MRKTKTITLSISLELEKELKEKSVSFGASALICTALFNFLQKSKEEIIKEQVDYITRKIQTKGHTYV